MLFPQVSVETEQVDHAAETQLKLIFRFLKLQQKLLGGAAERGREREKESKMLGKNTSLNVLIHLQNH